LATAALFLAVGVGVAGCTSTAASSSPSAKLTGTLELTTGTGASGVAFTALVADFTKKTGIKVDLHKISVTDLLQQQTLDLATGGGGDVITLQEGWIAQLADHLVPLNNDHFDTSHIIPAMLKQYTYNGKIYGYPSRVAGRVIIYRKDLFKAAGIAEPPKTFDELRADATKLTDPGKKVYGFLGPLQQSPDLTQNMFFPILFSFGGEIMNKDNTAAVFNNKRGQEALQYLVGLYRDHLMPPDAIEMDHSGAITAMAQGRAAMFMAYSPWLSNVSDPKQTKIPADDFVVAPYLPTSADSGLSHGLTLIGGWGFGINKNSKHQDLARKFVEYSVQPDVQKMLAINFGNTPVVNDVFTSAEYKKVQPQAPAVLAVDDGALSLPQLTVWPQAEADLQRAVSAALVGDQTAKAALDQAASEVDALIKQGSK